MRQDAPQRRNKMSKGNETTRTRVAWVAANFGEAIGCTRVGVKRKIGTDGCPFQDAKAVDNFFTRNLDDLCEQFILVEGSAPPRYVLKTADQRTAANQPPINEPATTAAAKPEKARVRDVYVTSATRIAWLQEKFPNGFVPSDIFAAEHEIGRPFKRPGDFQYLKTSSSHAAFNAAFATVDDEASGKTHYVPKNLPEAKPATDKAAATPIPLPAAPAPEVAVQAPVKSEPTTPNLREENERLKGELREAEARITAANAAATAAHVQVEVQKARLARMRIIMAPIRAVVIWVLACVEEAKARDPNPEK
ncbi:MAG: hypothetical protein NT003_03000 [Candidatus Magasanikbacteria bacterium]|nr:hypothetical protein [Candidatus Magasanikbacteria bacterium]